MTARHLLQSSINSGAAWEKLLSPPPTQGRYHDPSEISRCLAGSEDWMQESYHPFRVACFIFLGSIGPEREVVACAYLTSIT